MALTLLLVMLFCGSVAAACVVYGRHRWLMVRVTGLSMAPTLEPGDRVLVHRCRGDRISRGSIVLLRASSAELQGLPRGVWATETPRNGSVKWLVKRVAATPGEAVPNSVIRATSGVRVVPPGLVVVLGDSARSLDSRQFGFVEAGRVAGVVIARISRGAGEPTGESGLVGG
jgi:signal peptidase I